MKRRDFLRIVRKARNYTYTDVEKAAALTSMSGCALHSDRMLVTEKQFAYVLMWQAMQFNGEWDAAELGNMAEIAKRVDLI